MTTEETTTTEAVDAVTESTGATVDAEAQAGGTPSPEATADAEAPAEDSAEKSAEYWKAEAEAAFRARDEAKQGYSNSEEYKAIMAKAAATKKKLVALEALKLEADEKNAAEQGDFRELYGTAKTEADSLREQLATATKQFESFTTQHKEAKVRDALSEGYAKLGGIDAESFQALVTKQIADGAVTIDEKGRVVGTEKVLKEFQKNKPHLFGAPTAGLPAGDKKKTPKPNQSGLSMFVGPHTG